MKSLIIATKKSWNASNAYNFKKKYNNMYNIVIITDKNKLDKHILKDINPEYIFFPHWSDIIEEEIYANYKCVVFHMTDLPFGRGGSPLQNLICRGITETKISAIRVDGGIDTGSIYLKKDFQLYGTAEEILMRASDIIFNEMIPYIINNEISPREQSGEVEVFRRRKPSESEIKENFSLCEMFDYIRMLDGEGYPNAYIDFGNYYLKFSRASLKHKKIIADVEIIEKDDADEENFSSMRPSR